MSEYPKLVLAVVVSGGISAATTYAIMKSKFERFVDDLVQEQLDLERATAVLYSVEEEDEIEEQGDSSESDDVVDAAADNVVPTKKSKAKKEKTDYTQFHKPDEKLARDVVEIEAPVEEVDDVAETQEDSDEFGVEYISKMTPAEYSLLPSDSRFSFQYYTEDDVLVDSKGMPVDIESFISQEALALFDGKGAPDVLYVYNSIIEAGIEVLKRVASYGDTAFGGHLEHGDKSPRKFRNYYE